MQKIVRLAGFALRIFLVAGMLPGVCHSQSFQLKVVTTEYPPYSYTDKDGTISGVSTAIVAALLDALNISAPIESYPWSRAYHTALAEKNTLIYTMVRTAEREELFEWVGVVVQGASFLYSLKERTDIHIGYLDDAKPFTVGVVRNEIRSQYLKSQGFEHLDEADSSLKNARKLLLGWVDLWAVEDLTAEYTLINLGYDPEKYLKKQLALDLVLDGYLAFSKGSDPKLVDAFRRELARMKKTGEYEQIVRKSLRKSSDSWK